MEVEETPAPKSRRGRRGKAAQTVSVLETPLNIVSLVDIHVMTIKKILSWDRLLDIQYIYSLLEYSHGQRSHY